MGIPGRSKAHVLTKGRCFDRTGAMKEQTEEEPDKDKEVMEERIVEEEEPTVPPVQPVNSFFASLPDEDSDYRYLSEDEMENTAYILNLTGDMEF